MSRNLIKDILGQSFRVCHTDEAAAHICENIAVLELQRPDEALMWDIAVTQRVLFHILRQQLGDHFEAAEQAGIDNQTWTRRITKGRDWKEAEVSALSPMLGLGESGLTAEVSQLAEALDTRSY